ncbi:MAG TPA: hypothetical protein VM052_09590 [Candidatus Limnocylindrales bacterium]|nr:hypothetical protein [Candidatus Limnocylindrales bacterium]
MGYRILSSLIAAAAFVGSGAFVLAHPKSDAAPLRPPVASEAAKASAPTASTSPAKATPRITLQPGVRPTALPGITFTHVS